MPHPPASLLAAQRAPDPGLLAAWGLVTAAPALFTGHLSFDFIGWPLPFWLAAYGAPLAYLGIVGIYAWAMNRADARATDPAGVPASRRPGRPTRGADAVLRRHPARIRPAAAAHLPALHGGLRLLVLLLALAELAGMARSWIGYTFLMVTVSLYACIGIVPHLRPGRVLRGGAARAGLLQRHGHGGRLDVGGLVHRRGGHALHHRLRRPDIYVLGWTGGYVLVALLLAPYLRKFGSSPSPISWRALRRQSAAPARRGLRGAVLLHLPGGADLRRGHHHHAAHGHLVRAGHLRGAGRHAGVLVPGRHARRHLDAGGAVHHSGHRLSGAGGVAVGEGHRLAPAAVVGGHGAAADHRARGPPAQRPGRAGGAPPLARTGARDVPPPGGPAAIVGAGEGQAARLPDRAHRRRRAHGRGADGRARVVRLPA